MADKQATIYIIDQGATTGERRNGRDESDLDYAMRYVWDKIAHTMSLNRTTLSVGVIGLRTDETNNELAGSSAEDDDDDDDSYQHINVMKPLGPFGMHHLRQLQEAIRPNATVAGDAISAIVVAVHAIESFTTLKSGKPGKYVRRIVLVTDGRGVIDDEEQEQLDTIASKINEWDIELVIIGVDFDDLEYGFKEEDKDPLKIKNEAILRAFSQKCTSNVFGTALEAIEDLPVPRVKTVRPYSSFSGQLTLGDPVTHPETTISIDVERFTKTKLAKPASVSSYISNQSLVNEPQSEQSSATVVGDADVGTGMAAVRSARTYQVNDPSAPGGKKDVEIEELAKGFMYGRTAVPISESDQNITKFETFASFSLVGFIPNDKYEKYLTMGESCITLAHKTNDKAKLALSSFIHALHELDSYAIARLVAKEGKEPQMLLLSPLIEPDMEALIDVPLPFAEDFRSYRFPPLDKVITATGSVLHKHRYLPTDDLSDAMSKYVDSMDISAFGKDDDGEPKEYMTIDETYSPVVHRISQAIRRRAIVSTEPVAPPPEILLKWSKVPEELVEQSASDLKKLVEIADVKKVNTVKKGKRIKSDMAKPLSGLDVENLLGQAKRQKISAENAVPEFKQTMASVESDSAVFEAASQMASIVRSLITKSLGDSEYERAIENMRVMKEELVLIEDFEIYNTFIRDLKKRLIKGELGGDRREFWLHVRRNRLGLINDATIDVSNVSELDASEFYSLRTEIPSRTK